MPSWQENTCGLMIIMILTIQCVLAATQLMAKLVGQGSMAYILSTPTTQAKIAFTQAAVLISGIPVCCFSISILSFKRRFFPL